MKKRLYIFGNDTTGEVIGVKVNSEQQGRQRLCSALRRGRLWGSDRVVRNWRLVEIQKKHTWYKEAK